MSEPAIRAENLGKRYRIGAAAEVRRSLKETISQVLQAPVRNLRRLRGLSRFEEDEGADIIWALRDVSFEVDSGEALGIIGRNGAGKSTLLKILSRITQPTTGRAVVQGQIGALLEVGTGFHPELTGRDNVYLNGSILGMDRAYMDRRFDEIVEFAGVGKFVDTPVKRYSSGMKVRLAFAVAAHLEPEVLVIDEVLAVGDAEFQRKCLGKMGEVAGEGRTVLFVSHDMDAITRLCNRAILLDHGKVAARGPATEIVYNYLNGVSGTDNAAVWVPKGDPPGEDGVKLLSVRLLAPDGRAAATATVEDALDLEIRYRVERPRMRFRCVVNLLTQGVTAFSSVEPTEVERAEAGVYRSVVTIPANLLNEGHYTVHVGLMRSQGRSTYHANVQRAIAFQLTDPMRGTSSRGDYRGRLVGAVRPRLEWTTTSQNDVAALPLSPEVS